MALAERTEFFDFTVHLAGHEEPVTIEDLTHDTFATIVTNVASEWGVTKMNYESFRKIYSIYRPLGL